MFDVIWRGLRIFRMVSKVLKWFDVFGRCLEFRFVGNLVSVVFWSFLPSWVVQKLLEVGGAIWFEVVWKGWFGSDAVKMGAFEMSIKKKHATLIFCHRPAACLRWDRGSSTNLYAFHFGIIIRSRSLSMCPSDGNPTNCDHSIHIARAASGQEQLEDLFEQMPRLLDRNDLKMFLNNFQFSCINTIYKQLFPNHNNPPIPTTTRLP